MYLGGPQLHDICRRHDVQLVLKPFDFQAVAPQSGGIPLRTRPNWNKYPGWMVIAAQARGEDAFPLSHALLRARHERS